MTPLTYFLILLGATMTAVGGVFLKKGAELVVWNEGGLSLARTAIWNPQLVGGLALYVVPITFWILILRTNELSKVQPMLAIVYAITPILSILFLHETVSLMRWGGIFLIIAGVAFVSQS